jgi:hypothetical protein
MELVAFVMISIFTVLCIVTLLIRWLSTKEIEIPIFIAFAHAYLPSDQWLAIIICVKVQ